MSDTAKDTKPDNAADEETRKTVREIDGYLNKELDKAEEAGNEELMIRLYRAMIAFRKAL